jgi:hypothetical protein
MFSGTLNLLITQNGKRGKNAYIPDWQEKLVQPLVHAHQDAVGLLTGLHDDDVNPETGPSWWRRGGWELRVTISCARALSRMWQALVTSWSQAVVAIFEREVGDGGPTHTKYSLDVRPALALS